MAQLLAAGGPFSRADGSSCACGSLVSRGCLKRGGGRHTPRFAAELILARRTFPRSARFNFRFLAPLVVEDRRLLFFSPDGVDVSVACCMPASSVLVDVYAPAYVRRPMTSLSSTLVGGAAGRLTSRAVAD